MYYLYNDHNSTISNMAFEKYVILVIGDYLSSQGTKDTEAVFALA